MSAVMIIGAAASGKSKFAENYALKKAKKHIYLATMPIPKPNQTEIIAKIQKHKNRRKNYWINIEEEINIAKVIQEADNKNYPETCLLVDCLTLWLSNIFMQKTDLDIENEINKVATIAQKTRNIEVIFVTNEIGAGIIPVEKQLRRFRNLHGNMNQKIATISSQRYNVIAGIGQKF